MSKPEAFNINCDEIADPKMRNIIVQLLNVIEAQATDVRKLREENQKLRNENNRLKGEQGKPNIRKQTKPNQDLSSEADRNQKSSNKKPPKTQKKKDQLMVSRTQICELDKNGLPEDLVFKGYQSVVVQDIVIQQDNVEFKKEVYYSPSLNKTFIAEAPAGFEGGFGPVIKSLVLDMRHNNQCTESAIHGFLTNHGVVISAGTISNLLTENLDLFHDEKEAVIDAGLKSSLHQQMDDTGARIKGQNHYTHILCNDFYTAYFTRPGKDRLTILEILSRGQMSFHFTEPAYALMAQMGLPKKWLEVIKGRHPKEIMTHNETDALLQKLFPNAHKHLTNRTIVLEASAIAAYQQLPVAIKLLLTDDAPQFKKITDRLALCWIHDGRHYKKLTPWAVYNRKILEDFRGRYWDYYRKLLAYRLSPSLEKSDELEKEFDVLFATKTGYDHLDERIEKTKLKKESLLLVLKCPSLPLHNNNSELGARRQARYRDISFHNMSELGAKAKDTMMTLTQTAKKLAVNTYDFFYDRITQKYNIPVLAELINQKSQRFGFMSTA